MITKPDSHSPQNTSSNHRCFLWEFPLVFHVVNICSLLWSRCFCVMWQCSFILILYFTSHTNKWNIHVYVNAVSRWFFTIALGVNWQTNVITEKDYLLCKGVKWLLDLTFYSPARQRNCLTVTLPLFRSHTMWLWGWAQGGVGDWAVIWERMG